MNARGRIKKTLLKLLETTPADQLAVKTLIIEAKISKQTLYNNFYGILDAVCETVCDLFDEASEEYFGQENWMTGMKEAFRMLDEHKDSMMHLWNSKWRYDVLTALADHVYPIIMNGINECEAQAGLSVTDEDKAIIAGLYQDIFVGLIQRYMRERMEQDPDELLKIYGAILEKDTAYGLRRICGLYDMEK